MCATHCTQRGEPSSENQIPESSIIGQVSRLSSPPTSSSLEKRAAMVSPSAIIDRAPMIALGLTIAARFSSEELVGGLLNVLTWPMMLLSGIWFSLEGSPRWVQWVAHVFPLTHVLDAARAVMLDGAGLAQIAPHLLFLAVTALAFLAFGAWSFRWRID